MWTPKRIVLLSVSFLAFFLAYLAYAYTYVGRIDGLPPLPEGYHFEHQGTVPPITRRPRSDKLTQKLQLAFGEKADEQHWAIRIDIHSKGMVVAAKEFEVRDGRVFLTPLSIAIMGKERNDGLPPEIHTIRGDLAYLEFDRRVTNFSEIASRKVTRVELSGRIEVASNRRRLQRDQDLRVTIPTGTLYYYEESHRIQTEAYVTLEDHKSKPQPHKITGKGMEIQLAVDAEDGSARSRNRGRDTITGLKWITLQSTVKMDLYLESGAGLMASKPETSASTPTVQQRSHLRIETPGSFRYDLAKDHDLARFDVNPAGLQAKSQPASLLPRHVTVNRTNLHTGVSDHLVCQQLTMRLKRREAAKDGAPQPDQATPLEGVQIETIRATAPPGKSVVLVSNADNVSARGLDFYHDAMREITILKGLVEVEKDESKLRSREVRIQNVYPKGKPIAPIRGAAKGATKPYQHVVAQGPGDILFVDKKEARTLRAIWKETLTSTRDGNQDLLILTGNAQFVDAQAGQTLHGDVLKVWLEEVPTLQASGEKKGDSRRPRHLEATGNVVARSKDMNVHDTGRLVVWFKDVETPAQNLPQPRTNDGRPQATTMPGKTNFDSPLLPQPLPQGPAQPGRLASQSPNGKTPQPGSKEKGSSPCPFDLTARSVEAWILRNQQSSSIDQLWCEGSIHVKQEPAKIEEKGVEVKGETLRMTSTGGGNYNLVVTGDLAELQTDKIYVVGPEVNVEQATNKAWVVGDGAMKMESQTNFQGENLDKAVPLTVHWNKSMLFNGESAEFYGNIQATQEKARLACQWLQVYFSKPISLKHGNRADQPAKVRNLVCSKDVRVEDGTYANNRLVKYQRLESSCVEMESLDLDEPGSPATARGARGKQGGNAVSASGPGTIRIWEEGSTESLSLKPTPTGITSAKPAAPPGEKMRMTYVAFDRRMIANSKKSTAQFWTNVRVLHLPCSRHDAPINLDEILAVELPENALYIRCERLKVLDGMEGGRPNKQMEAHDKVRIQGKDFWAYADAVYYNELKQQIILEGKDGGNAVLYQAERRGDAPRTIEGKRLIYNRVTGEIEGQGVSSVTGQTNSSK